ncbi:hypothetical protein CE91St62_13980 [Lachnospiraceae bacterium]|nr:hypothetical protein CE91St61_14080 [Lachnospiraceae bacterium]BDF37337.1 hypothetical protein CE91St62_13980 [Lachnospiraceae bacterium]
METGRENKGRQEENWRFVGNESVALLYNIISLINDGAITFDDLEGFSYELKESVSAHAQNF